MRLFFARMFALSHRSPGWVYLIKTNIKMKRGNSKQTNGRVAVAKISNNDMQVQDLSMQITKSKAFDEMNMQQIESDLLAHRELWLIMSLKKDGERVNPDGVIQFSMASIFADCGQKNALEIIGSGENDQQLFALASHWGGDIVTLIEETSTVKVKWTRK